MKIKITTRTINENIAATALLYSLGYTYKGFISFEDLYNDYRSDKDFDYPSYPHIILDIDELDSLDYCRTHQCSKYKTIAWSGNIHKIIDLLVEETPVTMELTDEYDATVSADGIEVGCRTITFEKFRELSKIVEKFNK